VASEVIRRKSRKTIASALVFAVIAGIPLTIAALHPGFPVADVELTARDVWVTNGEQLLGGRLNDVPWRTMAPEAVMSHVGTLVMRRLG